MHLYTRMLHTTRLQSIRAKPFLLWLLLWAAIILFYLPAWKGGYQQDFQGWMQIYTDMPFWSVLNRQFAAVNSFYQLTQLQLWIITSVFGSHPVPWFLLFTGLHALNGVLLYRLCNNVMSDFRLPGAGWIAISGTLLVLFNPSMTEAVVWKACYHYHIALLIVLLMLHWSRQFLLTGAPKWAWRGIILFIAAAFTLEIWYAIPWLILLMAFTYYRGGIIPAKAFRRTLRCIFLPQIVLFAAHLAAYRAIWGTWMAHSSFTSAGDTSVAIIAGRIWSYEFHLLAAGRFFPYHVRQWIYHRIAESNWGWIVALAGLSVYAVTAAIYYPRWSPRARVAALFAGWSVISLSIVLHYIPDTLMRVSNDRYLYFTAFFQFMLAAVIIGGLLPDRKRLWAGISAVVLAASLTLTGILVWQWRQATKVFWGIQDNYRWYDTPVVLLLNLPCNYNGIGIVNAGETDDLGDHLRIYRHRTPRGKVYDVSSYNMQHPWDGAHVTVLDSLHLKVTLNQWGSWWWYRGRGALDYENEIYKLHFTDGAHEYILTLKQRPPGMVILFKQGMQWREVNMQKIDGEQW